MKGAKEKKYFHVINNENRSVENLPNLPNFNKSLLSVDMIRSNSSASIENATLDIVSST